MNRTSPGAEFAMDACNLLDVMSVVAYHPQNGEFAYTMGMSHLHSTYLRKCAQEVFVFVYSVSSMSPNSPPDDVLLAKDVHDWFWILVEFWGEEFEIWMRFLRRRVMEFIHQLLVGYIVVH